MKKKINLILLIIAAFGINSCMEKTDISLNQLSDYPVSVGNYWIYNRTIIIKYYDSINSTQITDIDTIIYSSKVFIEKDTLMNDTITVQKLVTQELESDNKSTQYIYSSNKGLQCYAYTGGLMCSPKNANIYIHPFSLLPINKTYNSNNSNNFNNIIYETPPTLIIKYPLNSESKWTYREPSGCFNMQIDREVIGIKLIQTQAGKFECFEVKWDYLDNEIFNGFSIVDYISNKGLVKRVITNNKVTITTYTGEPISGKTVQITQTIELKEVGIN